MYKVDSMQPVVDYILHAIQPRLHTDQRVLWLVSGGSAIAIAVAVRASLTSVSKLTVGLIDERYGEVGHADSNWRQLLDAGFDITELQILPVLTGRSFNETVQDYETRLTMAIESHDFRIGLLGIGPDGHTSGILPHSPAVDVDDRDVVGYKWQDYIRITTTLNSLQRLDEAVVCAFGEAKKPTLTDLVSKNLPVAVQPAQLLKRLPTTILYNDQVEVGKSEGTT